MGRDAQLGSVTVAQLAKKTILRVLDEGVELGRDASDFGVNLGSSLPDDPKNFVLRLSGRDGVSLNFYVDVGVVVKIVARGRRRCVLVFLGDLDAGTSLLLQRLDGSALSADNVGASGAGNRDLDCLLQGRQLASRIYF